MIRVTNTTVAAAPQIEPEPDAEVRDAIAAALAPERDDRAGWGDEAVREAVADAVPEDGPAPL